MASKPTVAFFGTGLMGLPMAERLLAAGYPLRAWNRTKAKALKLAAKGAVVADSPAAALEGSQVLVLMLADKPAAESSLAQAHEALAGKTVVNMGTISPKESLELAQLVEGAGGFFLEAPVLGSVGQAQEGSLEVMVAGKEELFRRWQALLQCFGTVTYLGPLGKATTLKLALNNLIASLAVAFATSLWLVERGGVSREVFLQILRRSALYAPTFDRKLPLLLDPTSGPVNFPTRHMLKDLRLISETARELRLAANLPETLVSLFAQALEAGWADADYAAVSWVIAGKPAPSSAKT